MILDWEIVLSGERYAELYWHIVRYAQGRSQVGDAWVWGSVSTAACKYQFIPVREKERPDTRAQHGYIHTAARSSDVGGS